MKKIGILLFIFLSLGLSAQDKILDVDQIDFQAVNLEQSIYKESKEEIDANFSIVYSPFLPAGAIYSIIDKSSGKEAVVQIGKANVNKSPYILYLPDNIFKFFTFGSTSKDVKITLKVKFLAWNKNGNEADSLNLSKLIVNTEDSYREVSKQGLDKYYIQLGSFSYYQNSYLLMTEMMPYLKIVPQFYLFKKTFTIENNEKKETYRLLVGPYSIEDAREISTKINYNKKMSVFIHSGETILKEFSPTKNGAK
jgi:hypothetical protein